MKARRDDFDKRFGDYSEEMATKSAERLEQFEIASVAHRNAVDRNNVIDGGAHFRQRRPSVVGQKGDGTGGEVGFQPHQCRQQQHDVAKSSQANGEDFHGVLTK